MSNLNYRFGSSQVMTSSRMLKFPKLGRLVFAIFGYTSLGNYARSRIFKRLLKRLPIRTFNTVLDLGAGLGEYTFMLAQAFASTRFTAVEILETRIAALNRVVENNNLPNVKIFPHKIEQLEQNNYYDFIFSVDVFEHIKKEEMPFDECYKKLKIGGYLLVKMPNVKNRTILPYSFFGDHNEWLDKEHVGQVYDLEGLKNRFINAGFAIYYAEYADGILARAGWEIAYFSKVLGSFFQLITLPLCKFLVILDGLKTNRKRGNTIQVIGRKI